CRARGCKWRMFKSWRIQHYLGLISSKDLKPGLCGKWKNALMDKYIRVVSYLSSFIGLGSGLLGLQDSDSD
ncbi:Hypothetical protein FKW44_002759, partial [Caligus rogercresseyi]